MQVYNHDTLRTEPQIARGLKDGTAHLVKERLIGVSQWAEEARDAVIFHASHDNPLLVEGEPGTGKEFIARLIHKCSPRAAAPFVAISCHQVSPESIEAALFGSKRMLASGHPQLQEGIVESADGGTLYINGVSSFIPSLQEKIARLVHYGEFQRQGDDSIKPADVRIIIGSAEPSPVAAGGGLVALRDRVTTAPLRERPDDIEPLARLFVKQFCQQVGKEMRDISADALAHLRCHDWPGNITELKSAIYQVVQRLTPPPIDSSLLPAHLLGATDSGSYRLPQCGMDLEEEVKQMEISLLCAALKRCHGVQYKAAQLLGLKATTLNTKLSRYGIDVAAFK
jgi:DNA-binding NtrC family response regulator